MSSRDSTVAGKRANHPVSAGPGWPGRIHRTSRLRMGSGRGRAPVRRGEGQGPALSAAADATAPCERGVSVSCSRLAPLGSGRSVTVTSRPKPETAATTALTLARPSAGKLGAFIGTYALTALLPALG